MVIVREQLLGEIVDTWRFLKVSYPSEFSNSLNSTSARDFLALDDGELKLITSGS